MKDDIPLHPKYGLNPTIPICWWCGNPKNEVAMLGNHYKGEAPKHMIVDYQPCEECEKQLKQGVSFVGADQDKYGNDIFRKAITVTPEIAKQILVKHPKCNEIIERHGVVVISVHQFDTIFANAIKEQEEQTND